MLCWAFSTLPFTSLSILHLKNSLCQPQALWIIKLLRHSLLIKHKTFVHRNSRCQAIHRRHNDKISSRWWAERKLLEPILEASRKRIVDGQWCDGLYYSFISSHLIHLFVTDCDQYFNESPLYASITQQWMLTWKPPIELSKLFLFLFTHSFPPSTKRSDL